MAFVVASKLWLVAAGFLVGLLVGLTGVGGGALMTPILILLFGFQPLSAVGTDLWFASATKTAGSFVNGLQGRIEWRVVGRLALGSVPAAAVTIVTLHSLGFADSVTNAVISKLLGGILVLTAVALALRRYLLKLYERRIGHLEYRQTRNFTILLGAILGVLVSSTSVGAGALGMTALILLYPELPAARLVASDIAHAVPLTFVAGAGHWLLGNVKLPLLTLLLLGSFPGIVVGSLIASRVPDGILRMIIATVLLMVAIRLLQ